MFNTPDRSPTFPASGPPRASSAMAQAIGLLGTVGGIAAAILIGPLVFSLTEDWLSAYLSRHWGDLSGLLLFAMFAVFATVLYVVTKISIMAALTAAIVSLAARRVP